MLANEDSSYVFCLGPPSGAGRSPYHSEPSIERPQAYHPHSTGQAKTPAVTDNPTLRATYLDATANHRLNTG